MIPQTQLNKLKPLQDIENRNKTIKGMGRKPVKKIHLTKKQRNFSDHPNPRKSDIRKKYEGQKNYRDYRNLPKLKDRKKHG